LISHLISVIMTCRA